MRLGNTFFYNKIAAIFSDIYSYLCDLSPGLNEFYIIFKVFKTETMPVNFIYDFELTRHFFYKKIFVSASIIILFREANFNRTTKKTSALLNFTELLNIQTNII